jgi:hypothetical protein
MLGPPFFCQISAKFSCIFIRRFLSYAAELSASLQPLPGGHDPRGGGRPLLTGPEGEGTSTQPQSTLSRVRNVWREITQWGIKKLFKIFFGGQECVGHSFALCRPFCVFERRLVSNPEGYRSKQARYQLSHPSPSLSHLSTWKNKKLTVR